MTANPYKTLLEPKRLRESSRGSLSALEESESDRARVLYSAAFRRLQRKTQVFPLEENAAVRSRLTHSLEVAHVGRYLATVAIKKLEDKGISFDSEDALAFANIVDTACLLHDLGNPPFGHFGEAAIVAWYGTWLKSLNRKTSCALADDLNCFDGNPQGFRISTSIGGIDQFGFNLTYAQLASTVKYPILPDGVVEGHSLRKKAGIFWAEENSWNRVRNGLNMPVGARFPLAYLMEAADDISYCLSDIEDGIEKGYTSHRDFYEAVKEELNKKGAPIKFYEEIENAAEKNKHSVDRTVFVRTQLIRRLVNIASETYVQDHEIVLDGSRKGLLDGDQDEACVLLSTIKSVVKSQLYGKRASVEIELGGQAAIRGILSRLQSLLTLPRGDFSVLLDPAGPPRKLSEEFRLLSLLPPKYLAGYERKAKDASDDEELFHRAHLMVDYVSGMTDVFAMSVHRKLGGIKFQ